MSKIPREFSQYIRPLQAYFSPDDVESYREFRQILKGCEHPGFTGYQVIYWLANDNHSGQTSLGYYLSSNCPYKPGPCESTETLKESDFDFERAYAALEPIAVKYF
jgi:hypothetical protein